MANDDRSPPDMFAPERHSGPTREFEMPETWISKNAGMNLKDASCQSIYAL